VAIGTDITERMQVQKRLQHLAHHDALTELPNRFLFAERLAHAIAGSRRSQRTLAVLFLDLDRFKLINDSLGHAAGDAALREVAARLRGCLRAEDTVARLGGDEFAVLLEDGAAADVAPVAGKLLRVLSEPLAVQTRELVVTASIGIALYPADGDDAELVLRNADAAMYRAKEEGRNAYAFYSRSLDASALERLVLESGLRRALARDELVLYYQPQVALDSGAVVSVEALLRWRRPDGEIVPACRFVPLAEETGLITEIDEWVLRAATRQIKAWQAQPHAPARVAINLSGRSLRKAVFTQTLAEIVRGAGVDLRALAFELTEGVVMADAEVTTGILAALGCRLGIDDFGTGYSSLSYLKRFPISLLKIDRSFVRDLPGDKDDAAIVNTIVAMARSLRLEVVAEGVETRAQLDFLRASGCARMQGYLFAPALAADELLAFVRRGAHLPPPAP
jgi:diguanylate cyclase (GGDEF)-like protein